MKINKKNPLQQGMLKQGWSELQIFKYYYNFHKGCMDDTNKDLDSTKKKNKKILEVIKDNYNFHNEMFRKYKYKIKCLERTQPAPKEKK